MSWDIFVQNFPTEAKTPDEIPDNFVSQPIGSRDEIIAKIKEVVPTANFSDKAWGIIDGPDFSIEVNLGNKDLLTGFAFHVRGSDMAAACIIAILQHLNLRALDTTTGDFLNPNQAAKSLQQWRTYQDKILSQKSQ
jgi:hypothetical protein